MSSYLEQKPKQIETVAQILNKLILPTSISGDAKAMHTVVISIVARDLGKSLSAIGTKDDSNKNLSAISEVLRSYEPYEKGTYSSMSELESWRMTSGGTLKGAFRHTLQNLFTWSSNIPPSYSHRIILTLIRIMGAHGVLNLIVDELKIQPSGVSAIALDVVTALISAPTAEDSPIPTSLAFNSSKQFQQSRKRLNLQEALRLEANDATRLFSSDPLAAETIARLNNRVEAQLSFGELPSVIQAPIDEVIQSMDITTNDPVVEAVANTTSGEAIQQPMDISAVGIGLDMSNTGDAHELGQAEPLLTTNDDDIFAGITFDSI